MLDALDGLVFLVAQLAVLLAVAAVLGVLVGRYVWARGRIARLQAEVERLRAERSAAAPGTSVPSAPPAPGAAPPTGPWIPGYPDA